MDRLPEETSICIASHPTFSPINTSTSTPNQALNAKEALAGVDHILETFERFGVDLGLERILRLLQSLGNPHQAIPVIHVAGTNGKGSVCAYLSSVLAQAGLRVGRYTSPHLVDWTERICINGDAIDPAVLYRLLLQVQAIAHLQEPSPTQFEVITAAAWLYFAQQQIDVAVMEVGLGGRLDATNVCDRPLVSVITSISRDHWQRLGSTLDLIAFEKAGILKPQCPAVIGQLPPEAAAVVRERGKALSCPMHWVLPAEDLGQGEAAYPPIATLPASSSLEPIRYTLPLPGAHQRMNSALAIATLQVLQQQGWDISPGAIAAGIERTRWPGRIQWVRWRGHDLLIDGAHNGASAAMLRRYVDEGDRIHPPVIWVMGMLSTKDHGEIFQALLRPGDGLHLVPVPDHSSAQTEDLAALATQVCPTLSQCRTYGNLSAALSTAFEAAQKMAPEPTVILCGSLYLLGHFLRAELQG
ncbi:MAG: folylpolyglutamate synthase/dihydrofolate synthase family protein [Synechococcales bacterium]|nr:folylpolyglutamate synthase/dihydrofolate synthase family protein [Synechococcales bacterium]